MLCSSHIDGSSGVPRARGGRGRGGEGEGGGDELTRLRKRVRSRDLVFVLELEAPRVVLECAAKDAVGVGPRLDDEAVDDAVEGSPLEGVLPARALVALRDNALLPL